MTAPLGVASIGCASHRHPETTLGMHTTPTAHRETDARTAPQCSRPYTDGAGLRFRCGGPMAPVRRPGMWSCGWCGKIELTVTLAAA
jgi:hypothetical protein